MQLEKLRAGLRQVGRNGDVSLSRQLAGELLEGLGAAGAEHQGGAAVGERFRDRPPKPARGAGEQSCRPRELH